MIIPTDVRGTELKVGDCVAYATSGYRGSAHIKFRKVGMIKDGRVYLELENQNGKVSPVPLNDRLSYVLPQGQHPHLLIINEVENESPSVE